MSTPTVSLVVRIVAKPGLEEEVARFLASAVTLAHAESFTPIWLALRASRSVFYIVDAFADDTARIRHLNGAIAAALLARASELLAEPPIIEKAEVLGVKLPGDGLPS